MASNRGGQQLNVQNIPIPQLKKIQEQVGAEHDLLSRNLATLKVANSKFDASREALGDIAKKEDGDVVLVPLTSSLYVPGKLATKNRVLVDIGTGYYVNREISKAQDLLVRKQTVLAEQMESVESAIIEKEESLKVINSVLQAKVAMAEREAKSSGLQTITE